MNKKKIKKSFKVNKIFIFIFCVGVFFFANQACASVAEKKIETLEEKKERLKVMIDVTKNKQSSLSNQIQLMNLQINNFENDLAITKKKIEENEGALEMLDIEVDKYRKVVDEQKKELASMLRLFYRTEKNVALSFMAENSDVSMVLSQSQYIDQASAKINKAILTTKKESDVLEDKKKQVEEKNQELQDYKETFEEKVEYLEDEEQSKKFLLKETAGQETQYKQLLSRVEEQMKELIGNLDDLSVDTRSDLTAIKNSASKPTSGLASTKWYYAQDDKAWGNKRIGLSNTLMKDYGCAVTTVAMVLTQHGERITPGSLSGKPIFARDLIMWPGSWGDVELDSTTWHGNIDWKEIDKSIENDKPVIVFIRSGSGAGHYVVVHGKDKKGDYVVHDPLFGSNIYLNTSRKLVGRIYNSSTTVDQMIVYK
jgi:peptidoglycan hydrolase CwlO-like protein